MKKILLEEIKKCITSWDEADIYAISLFVNDEEDNPCQPTVTLGYNTISNMKSEIGFASDEQEAKWNYAFWLQNEELVFGMEESQEIVKNWLAKRGISYISTEELFGEKNEEAVYDKIDSMHYITEAFVNELIEIVQELHESGFIINKFGKSIPVLIHELEYYDEIAEQNLKANPQELVDEFVRFCKDM